MRVGQATGTYLDFSRDFGWQRPVGVSRSRRYRLGSTAVLQFRRITVAADQDLGADRPERSCWQTLTPPERHGSHGLKGPSRLVPVRNGRCGQHPKRMGISRMLFTLHPPVRCPANNSSTVRQGNEFATWESVRLWVSRLGCNP